ncbi:unnamed protein product [Vicia faba]|uniref:Bacterial Ig-like domain-containing protein n=1 Tax=Vicia faba TaxID=3906 RepID=A0AAV1B5H6_VICFA|nr:unnamed protein product [Vicia faba]
MILLRVLRLFIFCLVLSTLCSITKCGSSDVTLKFLKAPHAFSHLNSATFAFEVLNSGSNRTCSNCSLSCKLDDGVASVCTNGRVTYSSLQDGNHGFEVCTNGNHSFVGCASYNWTVDTIPPTAYVTASTTFTSSSNVSVNISFTEPCRGEGFGCKSVNACNLLVYGAGQVVPSSFRVLKPNLMYSLLVSLSPTVQYGRAILVMDRSFCTDIAGNSFTRMANSSVHLHIDRRKVYVNIRTRVPEKLLRINSETRTIQATNDLNKLKVYLYFSSPIVNSSMEVMSSLNISRGSLVPTSAENLGNRRFGFMIANISSTAIVSVEFNLKSIITRQGTHVSPTAPVNFLYDSKRPAVMLSTHRMKTKDHNIQILIEFSKPVFGFNNSRVSISGGLLKSFHKLRWSTYILELQADDDLVFVSVPENVTRDVSGNKNLASNVLQVRHYSVPLISSVISAFTTATFMLTSIVAGLLTISTASLQSSDITLARFGDRGLNLRMSNPLYLHNILEDKRFAKCRIVYLDFGLAIPKLSVHGMVSAVKDLLEQAPLNKVMFSTDAYAFPEHFYLGAKNVRKVVFTVLRDSCIDGDLTVSEAVEAAKDLFARNSINFYKIIS